MRVATSLALALLFPLAVAAQQTEPFAGDWSGTVVGGNGNELFLEVTIAGAAGTWRLVPHGAQERKNACLGRTFPIRITAQTESDLKFDVNEASVLAGCPDLTITLHSSGGKVLEGTTANGRSVKLSRP